MERDHGYLTTIVELSKRLNTVFRRSDQLQAYFEAIRGISSSIILIYCGFCSNKENGMDEIYAYRAAQRSVSIDTWDSLRSDEKECFLATLRAARAAAQGSSTTRMCKSVPWGSGKASQRGDGGHGGVLGRYFFTTQTGVEGIILVIGDKEVNTQLSRHQYDALRVCTELLSAAIENGDLFEKVLRAKQEWERTVDAIRDVVMIIGSDHIIRRANRRLSEHAAIALDKMQGNRCYVLLYNRETPCEGCPARDTMGSKAESTNEVRSLAGEKTYQVWTYPIINSSGSIDSIAVYEKDITEYKEMQRQLLHAEKMAVIGRLASAVAHELNNPLSGVLSFSQILLKETDPLSQLHDDVKVLEHSALRCKKIVEELLAFSRKPETHTVETVIVEEIIRKALSIVEHRFLMKGIKVSLDIEQDLPAISSNQDQLEQVLINLICNADDAMAPGGMLSIKARRDDRAGALVISVQDTGCGIPQENLEKIFDPFYTTKGPGEGTGLGLSICARIVDSLGGQIDVSSEYGKGSVFTVKLPVTRKAFFSEGI